MNPRIMNEERVRFQDITHPDLLNEPYILNKYRQVPEFLVDWILSAVFPSTAQLNSDHWGVPVIPKLLVRHYNYFEAFKIRSQILNEPFHALECLRERWETREITGIETRIDHCYGRSVPGFKSVGRCKITQRAGWK